MTKPSVNEADPTLEKILSGHGLKLTDLDRICPQRLRNEIAVKVAHHFDEWETVGRCLDFSRETIRDIDRANTSQELCGIALLDAWSERDGPRATYLKLADVFFHRRLQRYDLVNLLCIKLKLTSSLGQSLPLSVLSVTTGGGDLEVPPGSGNDTKHQNSSGMLLL